MNILKLTDGNPIKYSESRLKRDNPNVSFPSPLNDTVLADFDCYTYIIDPNPEYNKTLQYVKWNFEYRNYPDFSKVWVQAWDVIDFEEDPAKNRLKNSITSDRWDMEQAGVEWLDKNFDLWRIATNENSQVKMTSVLSMLTADPTSTGYASWKMDKKVTVTYPDVDEEGNEIETTQEVWQKEFRHNTLEDWNEMVSLVSTHIKNCFTAEENAIAKANAGDLSVTFQSEYEKL
jgi:hypothetical protein